MNKKNGNIAYLWSSRKKTNNVLIRTYIRTHVQVSLIGNKYGQDEEEVGKTQLN